MYPSELQFFKSKERHFFFPIATLMEIAHAIPHV